MRVFKSGIIGALAVAAVLGAATMARAQADVPQPPPAAFPQRDGSHDFDFLIGDWKARVKVLKNRLNNSKSPADWTVLQGVSNHHKILNSNANFEEFDTVNTETGKPNKGQTLRLYNPATRQWSIYLVDVDLGTLDLPPVIGHFEGKRGEFYNQDLFKGRAKLTRYVWLDISPHAARMEQSFSTDGGKTWEVNWICELTR